MLSQVPRKKKRFYYDINIANNVFTNPSGAPYLAQFAEARNTPLFNDSPDKYCLSVVRFTVPSALIPFQYVSTIFDSVNPLNPNKMTYSISMKYLGVVYTQNLEWVTQVDFVPVPPPTPAGPDTRFRDPAFYLYYGLYNIGHFCELINTAFKTCFNTNIVPLLPVPGPGLAYQPPYMVFDGGTNLFTLWVTELFMGEVPTVILGGNDLYNSNFETSWDTTALAVKSPDGLDFRWVCIENRQNRVNDPTDPGLYAFRFRQEFDTTGFISKFQSLLFVSPTLSCNNDVVSNASVPQDPGSSGNNFGSVAGGFLPLVTDFEIDQSTVRNKQAFIHYVPTAEFRRLTMRGKQPITQVSLDIFWKDIAGNIYPVIIQTNSAATIKILFEEQ